jgi:hypothetical protein
MLADETSQHGYLVRALLGALRRTNEPPTAEETLAAWRRVVDRDGGAGIEFAIDALLDLKDVESRDKIAAAINRASSYWGGGDYRVDVEKLRRRFRAAMPEPSTAEAPVRDNPPSPR